MHRAIRRPLFARSYGDDALIRAFPFWDASVAADIAKNLCWTPSGGQGAADSLFSTTRASGAYADDSTGAWSLFASGVPRINDLGLLTEESRTNSIRNNSMQGAVAGTPGTDPTTWSLTTPLAGLAKTIVGTGTQNGIDYIDVRYVGTTSATTGIILFESTPTQIAAVQNQVWTDGAFLALTINSGATPTITLRISERNGAGSQIDARDSSALAVTSTLTRFSFTATLAQALTASIVPQILFGFADATAYDFTLRIGWPQLELGSFATSPIRTTSAAATRNADVITLTSVPVSGTTWSAFAEAILTEIGGTRYILAESSNNRVLYTGATGSVSAYNGSSIVGATAGSGGWLTGAKAAIGADGSGRSIAMNGGAVGTNANTQSFPTTLAFGGATGAVGIMRIRKFALWGTKLPDARLQALSV